ncbi:uncharacterized protein LOC115574830 isoform X1 [Sparus aurata]|uniref:uncharacterized protein LOC115574830 isoform X1 n=1 Tax=Sparus aurata TaxID=8175 RepID=UPI0011C166C0|nr:uncharacterized protein LOC115574830 isoform X1 [Sparus aurata]
MSESKDIGALIHRFSDLHTNDSPIHMEQLVQMLLEIQRAQQEMNNALLQQQIRANQLKEQELQQLSRSKPNPRECTDKCSGHRGHFGGTPFSPLLPPLCSEARATVSGDQKKNDRVTEQLLVPQPHRPTVLQLAHTHLMGAHLGVEKTKERVLQRFFWPGVHKEVENYCRSCPECQVNAPTQTYRSPLVPLPIIETPFERVGMYIVGPFTKECSGTPVHFGLWEHFLVSHGGLCQTTKTISIL